jgi:hypothetical protein
MNFLDSCIEQMVAEKKDVTLALSRHRDGSLVGLKLLFDLKKGR